MASNTTGSLRYIRKKFHETHDLISTSYHEAGHIIYGTLHGINMGTVCVFKSKNSNAVSGKSYYELELSDIQDPVLFDDRLHALIGLSYAGFVAEKSHFKMISGSDKFPMFLKDGSSDDFSEATALFEKYNLSEPGRKRYNYKQKLIRTVGQELQENWDAVTLVAHGLFKSKRIVIQELKELLTKKSENKDFWRKKFKVLEELYGNSEPLDEKDIRSILSL
jgi:hypothetical protein